MSLLRLGCCAVQDPHEAVAVRVVVYGGGDGLGPAHQDQVEAGVALVHQVTGVLVLVPLCEPLEVLRVELVPEDEVDYELEKRNSQINMSFLDNL